MTIGEILNALRRFNIEAELIAGIPETVINGITTDSRLVKSGDLFVAVKGTSTDGHLFIQDALKKGAIAAIVQSDRLSSHLSFLLRERSRSEAAIIAVPDSQKALAIAASAFYGFPTEKLHLIGVTGTNGKTTTTVLIESIFRQAGFEVGRVGTIGYCWMGNLIPAPLTTPDPIMLQRLFAQMIEDGVTHVVMEVSSHALSQKRIFGSFYDVAVFTNLSHDHLDYHKTMEDYFHAKSLLFLDHLGYSESTRPPGKAVINVDDAYGARLVEMLHGRKIEILTYGIRSESATIRPLSYRCSAEGTSMTVRTSVGEIFIESNLLGRLNIYNMLAAIGAAVASGLSVEDITNGIKSVRGVDGRLEKVPINAPFHVIVDYAHTPDAMEKALSCIKEWAPNRVITVFGCGGDRDRTKRPVMAEVAARYSDIVIITSDNPRTEDPQKIINDILTGMPSDWAKLNSDEKSQQSVLSSRFYYVIVDRKKAINRALHIAQPGDVIFIGGKGHETYQIIGRDKIPFDDRCVARECYDKMCRQDIAHNLE